NIRMNFDHDWVQSRVGLWLRSFFDHDFVFVADSSYALIYALLGRNSGEPTWLSTLGPDLAPTLSFVRSPTAAPPYRGMQISESDHSAGSSSNRAVLLQTV